MITNFDTFVKSFTIEDYQSMAGPDWPSYNDLTIGKNIPEFVVTELTEMFQQLRDKEEQVKTFCVLPFYGVEYPENVACCLMTKNVNLEQVRQDMLVGKRPSACNKCWHLEDQNIPSDRVIKNAALDRYLGKGIFEIFNDCMNGNYQTQHYKIDTSNTCNAACITCSSNASSTWGKILQKNNQPIDPHWQLTLDDKILDIDYPNAKCVIFRGGESTLSKTNFDILKKLLDSGNKSCFVSFVTNGSFRLSRAQTDLLCQFDTVNFCFSIDGINKVFEYMRYPLEWNDILRNLDYCRDNNFIVSISYTVSNVNVMYHVQTTEWFKANQLEYIVNPVYSPVEYRPNALPQNVKNYLVSMYPGLNSLFTPHTPRDDIDFELFKQKIAKQDQWKGISIIDYLPEFAELIK